MTYFRALGILIVQNPQNMPRRTIPVRGKVYNTSSNDGAIVDEEFYGDLSTKALYWDPKGYVNVVVDSKTVLLHRYIYQHCLGKEIPEGQVIHHKNNLKNDNRAENLELTTHAHNMAAVSRKQSSSTSVFKGVYKDKIRGWVAMIRGPNKTTINLGSFSSEEVAAKVYDQAFVAVHGTSSGCNSTLSSEHVEHIMANRQDFMPRPKKADRVLPTYIVKFQESFRVRIRRCGQVLYQGVFKSLDEAIEFRDFSLQRMKDEEYANIRDKPITRNDQGIAIISIKVPKSSDLVYALVDDADYYDMITVKWHLNKYGYPMASGKGEMHTVILPKTNRSIVIDHINNDRLDNRRSNLRAVSYSFNNRNRGKRDGCSSKYVGVSRKGERWQAGISINGKRKALGTFDREEDAAKRYREVYESLEADEMKSEK